MRCFWLVLRSGLWVLLVMVGVGVGVVGDVVLLLSEVGGVEVGLALVGFSALCRFGFGRLGGG